MPLYVFRNTETNEIFDKLCSWSAREEYLKENPTIEPVISMPMINYRGVGDEVKSSEGFNEVMSKIGEAHPNSTVGERYRKNKTIKEVKTQEVVKKHLGK